MKERFYIVPAKIIESNFPDDMNKILEVSAVVETEKTVTEIAENLIKTGGQRLYDSTFGFD